MSSWSNRSVWQCDRRSFSSMAPKSHPAVAGPVGRPIMPGSKGKAAAPGDGQTGRCSRIWRDDMSGQRPPNSVPKIWQSAEAPAIRKSFLLKLEDHLDILHQSRQLLPADLTLGSVGLAALFVSLITNFDKWQTGQIIKLTLYVGATVIICVGLTYLLLPPGRALLRSMYRRRLAKAGLIGKPVDSTVDAAGISYTSSVRRLPVPGIRFTRSRKTPELFISGCPGRCPSHGLHGCSSRRRSARTSETTFRVGQDGCCPSRSSLGWERQEE